MSAPKNTPEGPKWPHLGYAFRRVEHTNVFRGQVAREDSAYLNSGLTSLESAVLSAAEDGLTQKDIRERLHLGERRFRMAWDRVKIILGRRYGQDADSEGSWQERELGKD